RIQEAQDLISLSKTTLLEHDYEGTIKNAEMCKEECIRIMEDCVNDSIMMAGAMIESARESGVIIASAEKLLDESKKLLANRDYQNARSKAIDASALSQQLKDTLSTINSKQALLDEKIAEAKQAGINLKGILEMGEAVKKLKEDAEYPKALETLENALEQIHSRIDKYFRVIAGMDKAKEEIRKASELGTTMQEAEASLRKIEELMSTHDYEKALTQLEDLFKELDRQQKRVVEDFLSRAEQKIYDAELRGAYVSRAEEEYQKAREFIEDRNYEKALSMAKKSIQSCEEIVTDFLNIRNALNRWKNIYCELLIVGCPLPSISYKFDNINRSLDEFDYNECKQILSEIEYDISSSAMSFLQNQLDISMKKVYSVEDKGAAVNLPKDLLKRARTAMNVKYFRLSYEYLILARSEAERTESNYVSLSTKLKELEEKYEKIKSLGVDSVKIKSLLEDVKVCLANNKFAEGGLKAEECAKEVNIKYEAAIEKIINEARKRISDARQLGIDVVGVQSIAEIAAEDLKSKQFDNALENAKDALERTNSLLKQYVQDMIMTLSFSIREGEELGLNTTLYKDVNEDLRVLVEAGEFQKALLLIEQTRSRIRQDLDGILRDIVQSAEQAIAQSAVLKIPVDDYKKNCEEGKKSFYEGRLQEALTHLRELLTKIYNDREEYLKSKIASVEQLIVKATELGFSSTDGEKDILSAKEKYAIKDYIAAFQFTEKAEKNVVMTLNNMIDEVVEAVMSKLKETQSLGVETSAVKSMLAEIEVLKNNRQYEKAISLAGQCEEACDSAVRAFVEKTIESAREVIFEAEHISADTREATMFLDRAVELMGKAEYQTALENAKQAKKKAENAQKVLVSDAISSAKAMLKDAQRINANIAPADAMIKQAIDKLTRSEYSDALSLAINASKEIEQAQLEVVSKSIDECQDMIQYAEMFDADTTKANQLLDLARDAIEVSDFVKAL
ncbi:MAG: hypothetical protein QW728_06470, partial [Thermoplasmata archaeon]